MDDDQQEKKKKLQEIINKMDEEKLDLALEILISISKDEH